MSTASSRCALYTLTPEPFILHQLVKSVRSLRAFNPSLPVRVLVYGRLPQYFVLPLQLMNCTVQERPPITTDTYPYLVKWLDLASVAEESVLLLDADTFFFDDPERLFEASGSYSLAARPAPECQLGENSYLGQRIRRAVIPEVLEKYHSWQGTQHFPVLNVGVMVFNQGFHRRISVERLREKYDFLMSGVLPYPSKNRHNRGEFSLSLVLAELTDFTWRDLGAHVAPFFEEWELGVRKLDPTVVHICYHNWFRFLDLARAPATCAEEAYLLNADFGLGRYHPTEDAIYIIPRPTLFPKPGLVRVQGALARVLQLLDGSSPLEEILTALDLPERGSASFVGSLKEQLKELVTLQRLRSYGR